MFKVGKDGNAQRFKLKGRKSKSLVVEPCECVWYLRPKSKGVDKLRSRWERVVWLGIVEEIGEALIGTELRVIKARSIRRRFYP